MFGLYSSGSVASAGASPESSRGRSFAPIFLRRLSDAVTGLSIVRPHLSTSHMLDWSFSSTKREGRDDCQDIDLPIGGNKSCHFTARVNAHRGKAAVLFLEARHFRLSSQIAGSGNVLPAAAGQEREGGNSSPLAEWRASSADFVFLRTGFTSNGGGEGWTCSIWLPSVSNSPMGMMSSLKVVLTTCDFASLLFAQHLGVTRLVEDPFGHFRMFLSSSRFASPTIHIEQGKRVSV